MNQEANFTQTLQAWMNTPDAQKDWAAGALLLLQLTGNQIMYRNISVNPKGKAEFIKGQLQKYLKFRLQKLTHDQVNEMQTLVDEIVKKVIKPDYVIYSPATSSTTATGENKSEEFAEFKAGKRADHDLLPDEIKALYVENLDIVHRMRELHLKLRTLSLDGATCPDSDRYPFLKEIITLDKRLHTNWDTYDHYILAPEQPVNPESTSVNPVEESVNPNDSAAIVEQPSIAVEEVSSEAKPKKKTTNKRTTKKASTKQ